MEQDEPQLGLRELKKRRTRFELSSTARRLVLDRGFDDITVEDIAKEAGVSARTFFNYYETKMDALLGPLDEPGTPQARIEFVAGGPTGVLVEDLIRLLQSRVEPASEMREHVAQIAAIAQTDERVLAAFLASCIKHEQALGALLGRRLGDGGSSEYVASTAAIMTTIMARSTLIWAGDSTGSLETTIREHCALVAQLFVGK